MKVIAANSTVRSIGRPAILVVLPKCMLRLTPVRMEPGWKRQINTVYCHKMVGRAKVSPPARKNPCKKGLIRAKPSGLFGQKIAKKKVPQWGLEPLLRRGHEGKETIALIAMNCGDSQYGCIFLMDLK